MKKYLLSLAVILAFAIYAVNQSFGAFKYTAAAQTSANSSTDIPAPQTANFRDGSYTGNVADAYYGLLQVKAVIQNGKLSDVVALKYPNDRETSIKISNTSLPKLKTEAIAAQSAKVDVVSDATQTSQGFIESLSSALAQAKN